jgi:orotidine-5'-phosphate decarboxylase
MNQSAPIIVAIDTPDLDIAKGWIKATEGIVCAYKLGLEFFSRHGSAGVRELRDFSDNDLFLDMKLHDIPNTVGAACEQLAQLKPKFLTVHASGGRAMVKSAVAGAPMVAITAITILTSLDSEELRAIGFAQPPLESAITLARLAQSAGARAIVCSPMEIAGIRSAVGSDMTIITPGVRPSESNQDDQKRTMDPRSAIAAGANYLVIGRPITSFWSQGASRMRERAEEIAQQVN